MSIESTDEIAGELVLKQESDYWEDETQISATYGFYYGAMSLLLLVFLILYLYTRDRWYLYFSLAIVFLIFWILSHSGNINYLIDINGPFLFSNVSRLNFILAHGIALWFFCQKVFHIKARFLWFNRLINGVSIFVFIIVLVTSIHYHS